MKRLKQSAILALLTLTLFGDNTAVAQESIEANKALLGQFAAEVFEKKDFSNLENMMHKNYIQHNPLVEQGSAGFKQFFTTWFDAVPDWQYKLEKLVAEGDTVWAYGTYSGTHQKEWLGIPATNKMYHMQAVDIFRIEDGKLAEHWDVIDTYGLFKQLGVID